MPKKLPSKTVDLNIMLTPAEKEMLAMMATVEKISMAAILRSAISSRFRMIHSNEPSCVDGTRCLCVNMHSLRKGEVPTDAELLDKVLSQDAL